MANHQSDVFIRGAVSQQIHSSFHPAESSEHTNGCATWWKLSRPHPLDFWRPQKGCFYQFLGHHELLSHFKAANTTEKGTLKTMFYFHHGRHFKIKWSYHSSCFKYTVSVFRLQTRAGLLSLWESATPSNWKVFSRSKEVVKLNLFSLKKLGLVFIYLLIYVSPRVTQSWTYSMPEPS